MVAPARPPVRVACALRVVAARFDAQRFFLFYREGQRWRAKGHVLGWLLRGMIDFAQARELWRSIK